MESTSYTTPFYWKTSTESVDYWNHGPIFVPGLIGVYTMTTKQLDIFPPWLTRTAEIRVARSKSGPNSTIPTTTEPTDDNIADITERDGDITEDTDTTEEPTTTIATTRRKCHFTKDWDFDNISVPMFTRRTKTSTTTHSSVATIPLPQPVAEKEDLRHTVYYDDTKPTKLRLRRKPTVATTRTTVKERNIEEPFSMFLRSLLKIVCEKRLPEFDLVNSFAGYVSQLIVEGKLTRLGSETTSYITKTIHDIMDFDPDGLTINCGIARDTLRQRRYQLTSRSNQLLDYLDDLYDEAEEEAMQRVLQEAAGYPDTGRSAGDIARNFVDEIFLKPMQRVSGTAAGDLLFKMITKNVQITMSSNRRTNLHRKRQVDDSVNFRSRRRGGTKRNETKRSSYNELDFLLPKKRHSKGRHHKQHGHGHTHYNKRKYMKLKRKYRRLKKLIKNETSSPSLGKNVTSAKVTDKVKIKPFEVNVTVFKNEVTPTLNEDIKNHNINDLKIEQNYDFAQLDAEPGKEKMNINNFLNDFDYDDDIKYRRNVPRNDDVLTDIHRQENAKLNTANHDANYYRKAYEKLHPRTTRANIFNTTEDTDEEVELKGNLYDAFRHMDFINVNARRNLRNDNVPKLNLHSDSFETDAEAHLKRNIYKVMRNNKSNEIRWE